MLFRAVSRICWSSMIKHWIILILKGKTLMIKISLCMIVKNEAAILSRCLDSVCDWWMRLLLWILAPPTIQRLSQQNTLTGFTISHGTMIFLLQEIFLFSLANMDYIYAPDADEILDEENRKRFLLLKEAFCRKLRSYRWNTAPSPNLTPFWMQEPSTGQNCLNVSGNLSGSIRSTRRSASHRLYLTVTLRFCTCRSPCTTNRDFSIFVDAFNREGTFSAKLRNMYAKELLKTGDEKDFCGGTSDFPPDIWFRHRHRRTERSRLCARTRLPDCRGTSTAFSRWHCGICCQHHAPKFVLNLELILRKPKIMRKLPSGIIMLRMRLPAF